MSAICLYLRSSNTDAGGLAAERTSAVGADHERAFERLAAFRGYGDRTGAGHNHRHLVLDDPQRRQLTGALFECGDKVPVLHIIAEGVETDFLR